MFEDIEVSWNEYVSRHRPSWPAGDPHHDLAAEVSGRFGQLDIVLDYVERAVAGMGSSNEERQHDVAWIRAAQPKLVSGELSAEQYMAGFWSSIHPPSREVLLARLRASREIGLFTEMFYHVAWRTGEAIDGSGQEFPGFKDFKPKGVTRVRNSLLQHPQRYSGVGRAGSMVVTSQGPALRVPNMAIVVSPMGDSRPTEESIDQGLYVNAREFHEQLATRLAREASKAT